MAGVWFCLEGDRTTLGEDPAYKLTVDECVRKLGLAPGGFLSDNPPKFNVGSRIGQIAGYKHVVVEVGEGEAPGWRAGFYRLQLTPSEVKARMDRQPAA